MCDIFSSAMTTTDGMRKIHNMIVISFLYNMKTTLNRDFEEFYPSDNYKEVPTCIDEVKKIFKWTLNEYHDYSDISESMKKE
ncbi:unnamed protein product, partial [Schistosoma turkestanicum]